MRTSLAAGLSFLSALVLFSATSTAAHHSMSMYDLDHEITVRGTIVSFAWSNPHTQIYFSLQDEKGSVEKWMAEGPSPNRLSRSGWTPETLKAGDQVTLIGNQAKDGSNQMRVNRLVLPNGQELRGYMH